MTTTNGRGSLEHGGRMGVTTWSFVEAPDGTMRRVTKIAMDAFLDGLAPLPGWTGGDVRMAEAVVTVRGRKVERVHHVTWDRVPVLADGLRDPEERHRVLELVMTTSGIGGDPEDGQLAAIKAEAASELLAYRWQPSEEQRSFVSDALRSVGRVGPDCASPATRPHGGAHRESAPVLGSGPIGRRVTRAGDTESST